MNMSCGWNRGQVVQWHELGSVRPNLLLCIRMLVSALVLLCCRGQRTLRHKQGSMRPSMGTAHTMSWRCLGMLRGVSCRQPARLGAEARTRPPTGGLCAQPRASLTRTCHMMVCGLLSMCCRVLACSRVKESSMCCHVLTCLGVKYSSMLSCAGLL